jgi:hypothetical protein
MSAARHLFTAAALIAVSGAAWACPPRSFSYHTPSYNVQRYSTHSPYAVPHHGYVVRSQTLIPQGQPLLNQGSPLAAPQPTPLQTLPNVAPSPTPAPLPPINPPAAPPINPNAGVNPNAGAAPLISVPQVSQTVVPGSASTVAPQN